MAPKGQRIGYIRVSSEDQNPERQLEGETLDRVFVERASGKDTQRPNLLDMLAYAREGDVVLSTKPRGPRGPRLPAVLQPDAPVNSPAPAPSPATTIPPTTATAKLATTPKTTEMFVRDKAAIVDRREQIRGQIRELQMEDFQLGAVQDYIEEKLSGKE